MATISLCMIVKNESEVLARCLKSAHGIYDELVIVDTGSTDKTVQIARKFTKNVYYFKWVDDFARARNYSFSHATGDYIMWLDADDVINPEMREKILTLKANLDALPADIVAMRYDLGGDFFSTRGRLFNRATNPTWQDEIHEYIPLAGNVRVFGDIYVKHMPTKTSHGDRNIKIYEKILARNGTLSPRAKYYYARELKDHGRIDKSLEWFNKFLDEGLGWVEDNIAACYNAAAIMNNSDSALDMLLRSFKYDAPRAEICCMIGYYYSAQKNFSHAARWFETALNLPSRESLGFVLVDFQKFIPAIELAVCYDALGDKKRANEFNEIAGTVKPTNPSYLQNKEYFSKLI